MRGTLEKHWELRDYHGSGSVWSSSPLTKQALDGGLVAWEIQHPNLKVERLIVYQGSIEGAKVLSLDKGLTLEFHPQK